MACIQLMSPNLPRACLWLTRPPVCCTTCVQAPALLTGQGLQLLLPCYQAEARAADAVDAARARAIVMCQLAWPVHRPAFMALMAPLSRRYASRTCPYPLCRLVLVAA